MRDHPASGALDTQSARFRRYTRAAVGLLTTSFLLSAAVIVILAAARPQNSSVVEQQARVTCGGCHAFPAPDILPRDAWRNEFVRMMFLRDKRVPPVGAAAYRSIELPADMQQALTFYLAGAPERLASPERWPDVNESPIRFEKTGLSMPDMPATPAVSHVALVDYSGDKKLDVLGSDMRQGVIFVGRPTSASSLSVVASVPHPAHVAMSDVDGDGRRDLLVAELGEFFPADHNKGAVIWLRGLPNGKFGAIWLDDWPRVADVESADFNNDGKNDFGVAAFGWHTTGQVAIAENRTSVPTQPQFVRHTVDPRHGSIHILPADLNRDGKIDFVTLLAQEFETVVAYINKGAGDFTFEQKVIYTAPHPNWGSSGIQLVDLDKDGDLDVLLTHGDTFDDGIVKPYHGIQWLENTGSYPFVEHSVAQLPGVHRAEAADVDNDGDLDIVACALLAGGSDVDEKTLPATIWLEQTRPGAFVRHTIEMGTPRHATLDVGDVDDDGDVDIVVGNFSINTPVSSWVDVWVNQGKKK
jgi:hypothetical protein